MEPEVGGGKLQFPLPAALISTLAPMRAFTEGCSSYGGSLWVSCILAWNGQPYWCQHHGKLVDSASEPSHPLQLKPQQVERQHLCPDRP